MAPSLRVVVNGMEFENPFLLGSGPPGTNAKVIMKSFDLGWGGNVCKTISLDHTKVINTNPRYAKLRDPDDAKKVFGFENIELISDRPFETWLEEFREIKKRYPKHILVASIMEEYRKEAWVEIVERVQETGVDAFEMNLSCPHGLPERRMGAAMGADPEIVREVVGWVKSVAKIPVWAKMTPNVGDVAASPKAAVAAGVDGISAINTILSVVGVDLDTLRPMPTVEGYTTPGGYSGMAARPIALRHVMEIAKAVPNTPISGMGGIYSGGDAAQFVALGCHTVQVCTGAMLQGYKVVQKMKQELEAVLAKHGFESLEQLRGQALPYFTTHHDLVSRQQAAKKEIGIGRDNETWQGEIDKETDSLTAN
ncbi:NAD-dependent dihydropyrimidine dehydrogenase subunit PreA [Pseudenhygromyxa sp. WMMC2535]|uniref:NAD-dependent dihydropyrimidine dehydrogenase subunit PreA n=1 Tax=Pseudenhygromyxa sp. WMMC2535 TaxID=2712867 RepID=UPI001554543D|nr:NAD-dependent dihydropyrimidine dehydrogenase subunit PreA [Pseudenhygromyxa sp. WMMC2535]NVB38484.1 NAD-dependent dihydropyrimidine dehydrogenase subunit PreA [Pseudenhygromyxa sp. WMMC2535]